MDVCDTEHDLIYIPSAYDLLIIDNKFGYWNMSPKDTLHVQHLGSARCNPFTVIARTLISNKQ